MPRKSLPGSHPKARPLHVQMPMPYTWQAPKTPQPSNRNSEIGHLKSRLSFSPSTPKPTLAAANAKRPMHLLKNNILINVLCKLQFVPLSAVQQYSVGQDGFTKTVAASFFDVYGTPATMLFTQTEEKTPSGSRYKQQITLSRGYLRISL